MKKLIAIAALLLMASTANAGQVTLIWDEIPTPPDRYEVYAAPVANGRNPLTVSFDYTNPAWAGTGTRCTINNLIDGQLYVFVCRAFVGTNSSGDSNRVVYEIPQIKLRVE